MRLFSTVEEAATTATARQPVTRPMFSSVPVNSSSGQFIRISRAPGRVYRLAA